MLISLQDLPKAVRDFVLCIDQEYVDRSAVQESLLKKGRGELAEDNSANDSTNEKQDSDEDLEVDESDSEESDDEMDESGIVVEKRAFRTRWMPYQTGLLLNPDICQSCGRAARRNGYVNNHTCYFSCTLRPGGIRLCESCLRSFYRWIDQNAELM